MQGHKKQNLNTCHINSCFWYNKGPYTRQANSSGFVLKWKSMWTVFWLLDKRQWTLYERCCWYSEIEFASRLEVSRSKDMLQPLWIYGRCIPIPFDIF